MKITKELFIATIDSIREQYDYDLAHTVKLNEIYDIDDLPPPNNSRLSNAIFKLLHSQFPPGDEPCEIQRFCFDLNFGRVDSVPVITVDNLWNELILKINVKCSNF